MAYISINELLDRLQYIRFRHVVIQNDFFSIKFNNVGSCKTVKVHEPSAFFEKVILIIANTIFLYLQLSILNKIIS